MVAVQQGGGGTHSQEGWLGAGLASGHAAVMDPNALRRVVRLLARA